MKNPRLILTTVAGTTICAIFALVFFGFRFGDFDQPPIYLLVLGLAGSLSLALLREKRVRDLIYLNLLIYLMFSIIIISISKPIIPVILFVYFLAMLLAVWVHIKYFDKKLEAVTVTRPLVLGAIMALFYVAANSVHQLLFLPPFSMRALLGNLPIGFLLGLAYGLGGELTDRYLLSFVDRSVGRSQDP